MEWKKETEKEEEEEIMKWSLHNEIGARTMLSLCAARNSNCLSEKALTQTNEKGVKYTHKTNCDLYLIFPFFLVLSEVCEGKNQQQRQRSALVFKNRR